ncbi:hypothetical protein C8R45DRAFT_946296 [Mycena sanguinolenta]|nr:hypothetical protein C8R45DRAFT_946296 [Mycena sanguinolenta]
MVAGRKCVRRQPARGAPCRNNQCLVSLPPLSTQANAQRTRTHCNEGHPDPEIAWLRGAHHRFGIGGACSFLFLLDIMDEEEEVVDTDWIQLSSFDIVGGMTGTIAGTFFLATSKVLSDSAGDCWDKPLDVNNAGVAVFTPTDSDKPLSGAFSVGKTRAWWRRDFFIPPLPNLFGKTASATQASIFQKRGLCSYLEFNTDICSTTSHRTDNQNDHEALRTSYDSAASGLFLLPRPPRKASVTNGTVEVSRCKAFTFPLTLL